MHRLDGLDLQRRLGGCRVDGQHPSSPQRVPAGMRRCDTSVPAASTNFTAARLLHGYVYIRR